MPIHLKSGPVMAPRGIAEGSKAFTLIHDAKFRLSVEGGGLTPDIVVPPAVTIKAPPAWSMLVPFGKFIIKATLVEMEAGVFTGSQA